MYRKHLFAFIFLLFWASGQIFAQCPAPSTIGAPAILHASCPGNGRIIAGTVSPVAATPNYYQYALYQSSAEIKPWQSSDTFTNINAGTYEIRVRTVCSTGFSAIITRNVTVNNTEMAPAISGITIDRAAKCTNGRITVTATGSGVLRYSLVPGLTEPDPTTNYIRIPQTSRIFDSLAAGTYYVRVYNGCNNAVTQEIIVPAFTDVANFKIDSWQPFGCDSFKVGTVLNNHISALGTNDVAISKWWITWPTGITDSFNTNPAPLGNPSDRSYKDLPLSRIDAALGTGGFPANLPNWPYTITGGYRDICGNIYRDTLIIRNPTKSLFIDQYTTDHCDSTSVLFYVNYTNLVQGWALGHYIKATTGVHYSLDNGASWKPARTNINPNIYSDYITLPRGINYTLKVAICGDTLTKNFTTNNIPPLNTIVRERNRRSCPGQTGLSVGTYNAGSGRIGISMNSAPAGQALLPFFEITGGSNQWFEPEQLRNLLPGTYSFTFYDTTATSCPRQTSQTINLSKAFSPFQVTLEQQCNGDLWVETNNTYTEYAFPDRPLGPYFNIAIYNTAGAKVYPAPSSSYHLGAQVSTTTTTRAVITASSLSSLVDGQYIIKARKHVALTEATDDTCSMVELPWTKGVNNGLNLNLSRFINGCPGGVSSIVAIAAQGKAPYTYTLRDPANAIVAPSSVSNIYNNLTNGATYTLQVIDACGSVVNRTMSVAGDLKLLVSANGPVVCVGDTASLILENMPGVTYEWQQNGIAIPGANTNKYSFNPVTFPQHSGVFKARVLLGNCQVFSAQFSLTPGTCTALPIKLGSFSAQANNTSVVLKWVTLTESQNKGFYVQRSEDGVKWNNLDFMASQAKDGKSRSPLAYTYTDRSIASGTYYYRLLQVSVDGSSDYSEVRKVSVFNVNDIRVIPNPARLSAVILGLHEGDMINIYTATGNQVYENIIPEFKRELTLNIEHWAKGIYHITVTHDNKQTSTHKLIVQ